MQQDRYSITQNFLRPFFDLSSIFQYGNFQKGDTIIDIGAGSGILAKFLALHSQHVIALEPDKKLYDQLVKNVPASVISSNLAFEEYVLPATPYKVFSNIPFAITSFVIKKLLADDNFSEGILFVQQEAADKFAGEQLESLNTMFSVIYGVEYQMDIAYFFSKSDFVPSPSVQVVALHIRKGIQPLCTDADMPAFRDFVAYAFNKSAPTVGTILRVLSPQIRQMLALNNKKPGNMTIQEYLHVFEIFKREEKLHASVHYFAKILSEQEKLQKIHRTRTNMDWRRTGKMI